MKINCFLGALILIFTVSLFTSCEKDGKDDDGPIVIDGLRPSVIYHEAVDEGEIFHIKYHYSYVGNRVSEVRKYVKDANDLWELEERSVYTYVNDWVTVQLLDDSGNEGPVHFKNKAIDGSMLEFQVIYSDGDTIKYKYTYDNLSGDLTKVERFENEEITNQHEYVYSGNQVSECITSNFANGNPSLNYKSEFVYQQYILTEIVNYQYWYAAGELTWVKFSKDDYIYFDERVSEIHNYYWDLDASEWVSGEKNEFFTYAFDSYGLLEKYEEIMLGYYYTLERQIEYEPGYGNLESFSDPEKNIRNYPIIF